MPKHLLFYDDKCGLCSRIVQWLLLRDRTACFMFAPLEGKTASLYLLPALKKSGSLVLIENIDSTSARAWISGKGALRIFWLLGGPWKIIGALSFLPSFFFDHAYYFVAKRRGRLFSKGCYLPSAAFAKRFLP